MGILIASPHSKDTKMKSSVWPGPGRDLFLPHVEETKACGSGKQRRIWSLSVYLCCTDIHKM